MKIAMISPIVESVPPKKYGGTERVVYTLTEELVRRGHEVTLFASGDSVTSARLLSVYPKSLREVKIDNLYGMNAWSMLNFGIAYQMQKEFDLIHDHTFEMSLPTANLSKTPVVMTLHGTLTPLNKKLYQTFNNINYVSISKAQASGQTNLNILGTVYNGLSMTHHPFSEKDEGYLLYIGRISFEKGVHLAIEAAQILNLPLIIAAKLDNSFSQDMTYFKEYIEPKLSEQIIWIGEVDERKRNELMSKALCFLHPATWKEPFGLTIIESMACGTPVIGFNTGSIPELVVNNRTGYIVEDLEGLISAILNIKKINRRECREHVLKNFSGKRMADGYLKIYEKVLEGTIEKDFKLATEEDYLDSNVNL